MGAEAVPGNGMEVEGAVAEAGNGKGGGTNLENDSGLPRLVLSLPQNHRNNKQNITSGPNPNASLFVSVPPASPPHPSIILSSILLIDSSIDSDRS